jgi:hypothetical protein
VEPDGSRLLERERLWETRAGIAALLGALLALAGFVLLQTALGGDANFEGLREAHDKSSSIWLSGAATAIGYALLTVPLLYLFRAVEGRSERVRGQFVGLVVVGPLLLGIAGLGLAAGTQEAANTYLDGKADSTLTPKQARAECVEDRKEKGAKDFAGEYEGEGGPAGQLAACQSQKREEDRASNAIKDSSVVTISQFLGFAGGLSLVVALFYTGLWSLRTGLLSRFWGSLGMAVGVAALIGLTPLALLWFAYLGFLILGRVPGGKPPAWGAGEAIPWPTPGEKVAAELEGPTEDGGPAADGPDDPPPSAGAPEGAGGERRKRKQRD